MKIPAVLTIAAVSALIFDYLLTGPISGVSAGCQSVGCYWVCFCAASKKPNGGGRRKIHRLTFNEITKKAVQEAIKKPLKLDRQNISIKIASDLPTELDAKTKAEGYATMVGDQALVVVGQFEAGDLELRQLAILDLGDLFEYKLTQPGSQTSHGL